MKYTANIFAVAITYQINQPECIVSYAIYHEIMFLRKIYDEIMFVLKNDKNSQSLC